MDIFKLHLFSGVLGQCLSPASFNPACCADLPLLGKEPGNVSL